MLKVDADQRMRRLSKPARQMLETAIEKAGSTHKLGRALGLADGSWVWRIQKGEAQASPLIVARLAHFLEADQFEVLRAFGHEELVNLLQKRR